MAKSQQRVSRVLGYNQVRICAGLKRAIWSSLLAVSCALAATGISASTAVSDTFRYLVSPGTVLAPRVLGAEPTHRGLDVFIDLSWYGRTWSFAFVTNAVLYGLLIFGIMTTISGLNETEPLTSGQNVKSPVFGNYR